MDKKGLRLRLEKAAKHLPPLAIKVDVPVSYFAKTYIRS